MFLILKNNSLGDFMQNPIRSEHHLGGIRKPTEVRIKEHWYKKKRNQRESIHGRESHDH